MKVLLVGDYPGDRLRSMQRYCELLRHGLEDEGVEVELLCPSVVLGARNKWLGYVDKLLLFRPVLRRAARSRPGWVVHILDQGNGMQAAWLPGCVVTCHDLLAIRAARGEFPGVRPGWTGCLQQRMILRGLRKARALVCVSAATREDAERLIGPAEVIPNGLEDAWAPLEAEQARPLLERVGVRREGYLLHVGGEQWYKNRAAAVRLFIALRQQGAHTPGLVLVGPPLAEAQAAELRAAGLTDEVTVTTGVPDEILRALYARAALLVFPSIAEGFGWPIVEAQACGCPVVTTDRSPMRETGGAAAIKTEEGAWLQGVLEVLEMDASRRAALVEAGRENARRFTVKRMARAYADFYRRLEE